jgi:polyisoprenoid-binding protein YceI
MGMKVKSLTLLAIAGILFTAAKYKNISSSESRTEFVSVTDEETITAYNEKATGTIDISTGAITVEVPMDEFQFKIPLMQKHYNSKGFLNTKKFPKAKFIGVIDNIADIYLKSDGSMTVPVSGKMTMKGKTQDLKTKSTLTIVGGKIKALTTLKVTLADYDVKFKKGKPSQNIAKEVTIKSMMEF